MKKRLITAVELKEIQLEILKTIHDFCLQNDIRYSLAAGTLLGAIRHKGYIPWDDDIDIMMPRPDYERFCRIFPNYSKHYKIQNYHTDDTYWYNFGKVIDTRTMLTEPGARTGVYVDVFIIDGLPDNEIVIQETESKVSYLIHHDLRYATREYKTKSMLTKKLIHYFKYLYRKTIVQKREITVNMIDSILKQNPFETSAKAGLLFYEHFECVLPISTYYYYQDIEFEKITLRCICDYHTYLKSDYGNYMELPPVQKRISHHHINAFKID